MPDLPKEVLKEHALYGAAFACRMFRDYPGRTEDARAAYAWAEKEFLRIARGEVDERDLVG
jgi:hypothetical protein